MYKLVTFKHTSCSVFYLFVVIYKVQWSWKILVSDWFAGVQKGLTGHFIYPVNGINSCTRYIKSQISIGTRADLFHYQFCQLLLVKKCPSQGPRAQSEVFKYLVLFDQQSIAQKYLIYNDMKCIRAANPHIIVAGTSKMFCVFV